MTASSPDLHWRTLLVTYNLENPLWEVAHSDILDPPCQGCEEKDDPRIYEYHFPLDADSVEVNTVPSLLDTYQSEGVIVEYHWQEQLIQNWVEKWRQEFQPFVFAGPVWVAPTWHKDKVPAGSPVILLEPKMAFGTGTHETTQLAGGLVWEWLVKNQTQLNHLKAADIGCGSGILGILIAQYCLQHSSVASSNWHVYLNDIDPVALENCQENVVINLPSTGSKQVTFSSAALSEEKLPPQKLVVANIISGVLQVIAAELIELTEPGGTLILSGILDVEQDRLTSLFLRTGLLELERHVKKGEWVGLQFRKK